ncbi:MAG: alanine--tRNA ligase [Candidatus Micrarchaeota archaeon]|nr:alanine--tRNA ligase [Candidatus Micrarchaeota archaeon]
MDKKELLFRFQENWREHYDLEVFRRYGFRRQRCKGCGRSFWSIQEREVCGDPSCSGYSFIGNPVGKPRGYVETWKAVEKYFVDTGHTSIEPFPTVARWRDDLYFTIASINDFQPYVVNGELDPIANPLIVPQPCIRFNDIDNVGVTGRHYTNFVMIGQHAFNRDRLFYWKDEALEHDINYITQVLRIPIEEIVFHEDVWVGGGNFGPSIEYFVRGLELGNCVFMQYEELPDGTYRELRTKVIDMGAGLSRLAWITNGNPMSYEIVFRKGYEYLVSRNSLKIDRDLYLRYAKIAGGLNVDEVSYDQYRELLRDFSEEDLKQIDILKAIFAILDHTSTLLFTVRDGMLPSNSGGGYNLRVISRRMFEMIDRYGIDVDFYKILELHMDEWRGLFDKYREGIDSTAEVIERERNKYNNNRKNVSKLLDRYRGRTITIDEAVLLYESEGVPIDMIEREFGLKLDYNFYNRLRKTDSKKKTIERTLNYNPTDKMYYRYPLDAEFEATVIGVEPDGVILDRTLFYPEGGGQVGDTGYLNDIRVNDTKKYGNVIIHVVQEPNRFRVGERVRGKVDIDRRLIVTKHHTAAHLLTQASYEILGVHVWQAGSYKSDTKAHMDISHYERIDLDTLMKIERRVNEVIFRGLPIRVEEMNRNEAEQRYGFRIYQGGAVPGKILRVVRIGDYDVQVCGGTHNMLQSTQEIGFFKIIKSKSVSDGVQRIEFKVERVALEYLQSLERTLREDAEKINTDLWDLGKTAIKFFERWKQAKKDRKEVD